MVASMGEDALNAVTKRPLCVKGAGTEGDWGIVDFHLYIGFLCLQSLRHSLNARATSLCTKEAKLEHLAWCFP